MGTYRITTYSDDCASAYLDGQPVGPEEYDLWGKWYPIVVDGQRVAEMLVDYGRGWEFHIRPIAGRTLAVDFEHGIEA